MAEFGAVGMIDVTVESIEGAEAAMQREVGPVEIPMETTPPSQRGVTGGGAGDIMSLDQERNAYLETIVDELQDDSGVMGGSGGGGAGGGGGPLPLPVGGASKLLGGGAVGGLLGGTAGVAAGGLGLAAGVIGGARYAMGEGLFGQAGENTLADRTQFEGIEGAKNAMENPLDAMGTGFKNMVDPSGMGEVMARSAATELMSRTTFDEEVAAGFEQGVNVWQQELSSIPDPFAGVDGAVSTLESADPLASLSTNSWPELPSPQGTDYWPKLPDPGTTQEFWPSLPTLEEPDWLSKLTGGGGGTGSSPSSSRVPQQNGFGANPRTPSGFDIPGPAGFDIDGLIQRVETLERALSGGLGGP